MREFNYEGINYECKNYQWDNYEWKYYEFLVLELGNVVASGTDRGYDICN